MTRLIRFSVQKSPLLSLSNSLVHSRSFVFHSSRERDGSPNTILCPKIPPLFLFEFQKFTLSLSSNSYIKKERERFRWRGIQLIFQAKVIVRLFSMLRQVLVQRDSRSSRFPRESLLNPTSD